MSVTILPYIDESKTVSQTSSVKADAVSAAASKNTTAFREILEAEKRACAAMAVDAMIAESSTGGVTGDAIQKMLGFRAQAVSGSGSVSGTVNPGSDTTSLQETSGSGDGKTASGTDSTSAASGSSNASTKGVSGCPKSLEDDFQEAAATYHVDENLLKAVAKAESGFDASATSSAGAMGVMQLMPSTAKSLGIQNAYNAHDNIMGGAKILSQNLSRYDGDISLALAGYNAGCGNVDKYGGIPPFEETENYVKKVLKYYKEAQG